MKCLSIILFLVCANYAQTQRDLDIYKGDSFTISFEAPYDVSSDSLLFVVKADRDDDTPRVIALRNTAGGGSDSEIEVIFSAVSTILVKLTQINTEGLTAALYVYDLTIDSTTTLYTGTLKLRDEVAGSADGVATRTPYYTIVIDTPSTTPAFIIGDNSDNSWSAVSFDTFRDTLLLAVTPEQFSTTNDTTAFSDMFASGTKLSIKLKVDKTYDIDGITNGGQISMLNAETVVFDGQNATIDFNSHFFTFTTGSDWTYGTHTGFSDSTNGLLVAYEQDTLFTANFVIGNNWVAIEDADDWDVTHFDMLFVSDDNTLNGDSYNGGVFVIDYIDIPALRLYFTKDITRLIDVSNPKVLRYVPSGGKTLVMKNLNVLNGGLRITGFEKVVLDNVNCFMDSTTWQALNISKSGAVNATFGINVLWNVVTDINDCTVNGYLITDVGYGVIVGMGDVFNINDLVGGDCRHITTSTIATGGGVWLNDYNINNSTASFSERAMDIIPNARAWDTHQGVDNFNIDKSTVYGGAAFAGLRGENLTMTNSKTIGSSAGVLLFSHQIDSTTNKKNVTISNSYFEDVPAVVSGSGGDLGKLIINNGTEIKNSSVIVAYGKSVGGSVDTTIIQNCIIENTKLGIFDQSLLIFKDNTVSGEISGRFLDARGSVKAEVTHNNFTNMISTSNELFRTDSLMDFTHNYVEVDSVGVSTPFVLIVEGWSILNVLYNIFIQNNYTATDVLRGLTGTTMTVAWNHFELNNNANHDAIKGNGNTINYGDNTYIGVSMPVDTSEVTGAVLGKFGN